MEGELSIEVEDGGMNNLIENWRGRREIMNNALAASAGGQDPAKAYEYARKLARVIEGGKVDEFLSMINVNDPLLRDIDWSAVLNSRLEWKGSLLHRAAATENDDILRLLVDYVGDHLITAQDDRGNTPLHWVAWLPGSTGAAEMLIHRARGLPNVEDKNLLLRMKNKWGNTALHIAVHEGHANLVRYLLSEDLEPVYWKNASEKSPLYLALETYDSAVHEALFSHSLEPSRIEGLPSIHGAIIRSRHDLFDLMLKKNMELFAMTDSNGGNVFHLAAHLNHAWVFEFLRPETEYLTREPDMNGDLPIHIASKMGYVEHIEKLREVSLLPNGQGKNILHIAAKYGRVSVVRYILSHPILGKNPILGKMLNATDDDGNTALHLAAMHSQPAALIDLLRTDGILPSIFNNECLLAVDIARRRHQAEGYNIRHQLAYLALACSLAGKGPLGNQELLLLRAKARDEELSVVRSRKSMPSRDIVKDYINSRMVVATLVATVSFAAGFAVPGGFNGSDTASKDERGMATMLDNRMFQAFAICNTIAMFCSMTVVVNLIWAQTVDVDVLVAAFERTTLPLQIALPAMSTAFLTGVTLTAGKLPWLANTIFYLGLVFLLIISFAKLLGGPIFFEIFGHPLRRLTFWLILAYIYLGRVETYIYDDDDAKDNRREKKTFASPPVDVAGESRTDDWAKAKCEDALHPPSR
ncbi:protein ACCELERATED CELL DEATH 6 [Eucalyptus grandis]|uniref:protein ACCELERATED CELL DEATH 6 n=1 Tax=Eucalyptus grandis TaxID=71139 RepID=UPI00192F0FC5|nr:protein ACCELERATED CELL DEATH 6 [Eucalyptus grandis]